jgi:hypothetical protein
MDIQRFSLFITNNNCVRNYADSDRETRIVCSLFHLSWPLPLQVSVPQIRVAFNHPHHPPKHRQKITAERSNSLTSDANQSGRICQGWGVNNRGGKMHSEFDKGKVCCIRQRNDSDLTYLRCCSNQGVDPTSLLWRSEGMAMAMQCNSHRIQSIVFINNSSYTQAREIKLAPLLQPDSRNELWASCPRDCLIESIIHCVMQNWCTNKLPQFS